MAVKVFRVSDQISADNLINLMANQFSLRLWNTFWFRLHKLPADLNDSIIAN